ncbi:DUF481 domain-containing protein [Sphingomonas sp. CROZ-RG-20F-R02-07]|uniref:DUF481 domain-containing protein n=1 Tax=Sphingomonas sp. CROZ-RG-20F-R02-07 TaxID=2914832 RepID=UPI001F5726DF|nr:DUF481 domain-containing protein [Sphingomonas sp. CROZ-RG-20F-R02-07]
MFAALLILPVAMANAPASDPANVPIPETIRAMLDAALASGNESDIATIVKYARAADPLSGDAVLAVADAWRHARDDQRTEHIRQANFLDLWSGKAELGGFLTTGSSETEGVTGAVSATREGIRWRQKFHGQIDYQESLGVTTRRHFLASYEPNYKIDDRAYVYGATQYESDRTLGFLDRYSASVGLGYSAIKRPGMALDLELGPAFRDTSFTDQTEQASPAARGTLNFKWQLTPGLTFTQAASAYLQRYDSSLGGTSAVSAKLIGPLSAQLSYNIQYESEPPIGSVRTNTTSRAGLVYTF